MMPTENVYTELGKSIRGYRTRQKMTQAELAKDICSTAHITHIENGFRTPNAIILYQIAERLRVPIELLFKPYNTLQKSMIDGLFNAIASEGAYDKLKEYVDFIEDNYTHLNKQNQLFVKTIKLYMNALFSRDYLKGAKDMEALFNHSSHDGYMSDVEFALICASYWLYYLAGNTEFAFMKYKEIYFKIPQVITINHEEVIIKFFTQISALSIDRGSYDLALRYIDEGIDYCKNYSNHILLPELLFHKGEACIYKGNQEEGESLIRDAINFSDLIYIKNKDFLSYIQKRLEKLNLTSMNE